MIRIDRTFLFCAVLIFLCKIDKNTGQRYDYSKDYNYDRHPGAPNKTIIIWCTVSRQEQQKCINFAMAVERDHISVGYEYFRLECKFAFNKDDCMALLDAEKVTLTSLDAGEVFVGGRFHSLIPIAQEITDGGFNYQYSVAVIKKGTIKDVASLRDLQGKRACFAGVGLMAGWVVPVYTLMKHGGMEVIDCNNHVRSTTNFFGPSCAVNALTDKYNPIGDNSDKLCSLCVGPLPGGRCTDADPYAGYEGAFRCLLESGDVAFLKHSTVDELTSGVEFSAVSKDTFELLCLDGSRQPLHKYRQCNWGSVPTNAIVTSSATSFEQRKKLQRFLEKVANRYSLYQNNQDRNNDQDRPRDGNRPEYDQFGNRAQNDRDRPQDDRDRPEFDQFGNRLRNKRQGNYLDRNEDRHGQGDSQYGQNANERYRPTGPPSRGVGDVFGDPPGEGFGQNENRYGGDRYGSNDNRYDPFSDRNQKDPFGFNRDDEYYNRKQFGNEPSVDEKDPYANDPFRRDPLFINRDQYGNNIDPYNTDDKKYHKDSDPFPDHDRDRDFSYFAPNGTNNTFYEMFNLFESSPKYGIHGNLIVQDSTRKFNPLSETQQTYSGFLGRSLDIIMGVRECPVNKMTLCVTSEVELEKCIKMRTALKAQLLKPEMVCHKAHSQINCMQAINSGNADVAVFDASDVYTGGLHYDLIPFMNEVYNLGSPEYYVVAVAKESDPSTELTYLKGKYTCHGGINTAAGWVYPLAYLISNGWIRPYGCNSIRAAAEYFTKSCVPGAISTEYNTGVPYDNMCDLCHGVSYRYCRRDASEDYYGHTGAFRCLVEGGGDVAFVKHTTVIENTGGKRREWWARDALIDDFELLCPDGTRAEVNEYKQCNLGKVKSNAIVTRGGYGYNETQINAYINLFLYSQTFYGRKIPDEFSFGMFYSTPPYTDLIFQDATTQLLVIPPEQRHYSDYLGSDYMRARRIVDCNAGASKIQTAILAALLPIIMTLFLV